jgi:hypothetical protein
MKITHEMVEDETVCEMHPHHFFTEASSLRLPVGQFPNRIETNLGNGQPFFLVQKDRDGRAYHYRQEFGNVELTVYND